MYMQTSAPPFPYQQPFYNHQHQQQQEFQQNGPPKPPPLPISKPNKPRKEKKPAADVNKIVDGVISQLKMKGIFDQFRRECVTDAEDKPYYKNLNSKVTATVDTFLKTQTWTPNFGKISVRNVMKRKIEESSYFKREIDSMIEQVLGSNMKSSFKPIIENEVYSFLGCEKKDGDQNKDQKDSSIEQQEPPTEQLQTPPQLPTEQKQTLALPESEALSLHQEAQTKQKQRQTPHHNMLQQQTQEHGMPHHPTRTQKHLPPHQQQTQKHHMPQQKQIQPVKREIQKQTLETLQVQQSQVQQIHVAYHENEYVEDEESEEESPMFEKIGEVSPPRPGLLENSEDILRELQEEARRNSECDKLKIKKASEMEDMDEDCKYLDPTPLFNKKLAYYKKLPEFDIH